MTAEYDVAVVGAGPAGATAALTVLVARPDARVLLLDRSDFPRDKCCGDGIAPHVLDVLRPLGAADLVDDWAPIVRLELSRGSRRVEGVMRRAVRVVPREVFDARLVDRAVRAGAQLRRQRVRDVVPTEDGVLVDGTIRASLVIAADGAHSAVRRSLGLPPHRRRALALRGYVRTSAGLAGRQVIRWGERRQPSYAWAFDRGDGWANVGYGELTGSGREGTRASMLAELDRLIPGVAARGRDWRGHHLPLSGWRAATDQRPGRVLFVGDAAGLVNPMTGEGIYYAVATGALAGRAAAVALGEGSPDAGSAYRRALAPALDTHLHHTWTAARLSRSTAVVDAGISAAGRDRRHFDALVELGLGDGRITPRLAGGLAAGLLRRSPPPHRKDV